MTRTNIIISLGLLLTLAAGGVWYSQKEADVAKGSGSADSENAIRIIDVVPFELSRPMTHYWRAERPTFTRGALLVVEADGALLAKRQGPAPILCCGAETLNVLNDGWQSGRAIVVMPWIDGMQAIDLEGMPLHFGPDGIAETLTKAKLQALSQTAEETGDNTISQAVAKQAQQEVRSLADEAALYREAATLVERFSPSERDLISWLRGNN